MGFALSTIELSAAALFLAADGLAWAARRPRWARWPLTAVALLLPLVLAAVFASGMVAQFGHFKIAVLLACVAALLTGTLLLGVFGLWRGRAADWPVGRLALGAGVAVALFVATLWSMVGGMQARVAALRAEAGTLALAAAPAPVPDRDDAAPLYEAAYELLRDTRTDHMEDVWHDRTKPLNVNDPALTKYLTKRAGGLELLRQAVRRPAARLDRLDRPGWRIESGNHLRHEANVLALAARVSAAKGQAGPAVRDAAGIFTMARHLATADAEMLTILVACALESVGLATLDQVLTLTAPTHEDLVPLRDLPPILFRHQLRRAILQEEASAFAGLAQLVDEQGGWGYGLMILDEELAAFRILTQLIERELSKPYPDSLTEWPHLEEVVKNPGEVVLSLPEQGGLVLPPAPLARLSVQAMLRLPAVVARADADHRVGQLGVAVAEFRAAEGRYPATADELVPKYLAQVPPDPFDGQPLRLKPAGAGVVVYSVGPDRVDDGGAPMTGEWPSPKGDISLRVGAAKK